MNRFVIVLWQSAAAHPLVWMGVLVGLLMLAAVLQLDRIRALWERSRYGKAVVIAGALLAAMGAATPAYVPFIGRGPFIDLGRYGAKCDGATDDTAALNAAIAVWQSGGNIISPQGATCVFKQAGLVNFTASSIAHKGIDLRGGTWLFQQASPGLTDLKFEETGAGEVEVENIDIRNGTIEDAGGTNAAATALEFNGGGGSLHFLDRISTENLHVIANATAAVPTVGIHVRSVFQSHFDNTKVDNTVATNITGAYDWYLQDEVTGDQATGNLSLNNCEGTGGDVGIYDTTQGNNVVSGGTYFGMARWAVWASGVNNEVLHGGIHWENTWNNNAGGASIRPDVECDGTCVIDGNYDYTAGGTQGQRNYVAKLFVSGSGIGGTNESRYGFTIASGGTLTAQAYIQTGSAWTVGTSNGHISLIGLAPAQVTDAAGASCASNGVTMPFCSNATFIGNDGTLWSPTANFATVSGAINTLNVLNGGTVAGADLNITHNLVLGTAATPYCIKFLPGVSAGDSIFWVCNGVHGSNRLTVSSGGTPNFDNDPVDFDNTGNIAATGNFKGTNVLLTGAAATAAAGQISFGHDTSASSSCGTLASSAGCIVVNIGGTVHYIPYY